MSESLRERATRVWPCARDLVFSYRAGDEDPRDFEPALPELELEPMTHAMFARLAGRALPTIQPIEGHTYDWGEDAAAITRDGDGLLVAHHAVRDPQRDEEPFHTVYHVIVRDDACVVVETGSRAQRVAQPRFVVRLSTTADAIDATTDAILELAPTFGLAFVERVDAPVRALYPSRSSGAVYAFEQVLAVEAHTTAYQFAWIVIGMLPRAFDYTMLSVEPGTGRDLTLVFARGDRNARVRLSDSRNIFCIRSERGGEENMSMHYVPGSEDYATAQRVLLAAIHWLSA